MNIPYEIVAETGVVATIEGARKGKTIALRADIDALELQDNKNVPYRSTIDGMCHACGHDGHTSMLLTSAKILNDIKDTFSGTVKLIFQPGEESIVGAVTMMENSNFLDDVDTIFGIHLMLDEKTGVLSYCDSSCAASADGFRIEITGLGGHGATPHLAIDAGLVASAIFINAQSIVSREISPMEPAVISFGIINAGSRYNIIPNESVLEGTIRSYNPHVRKQLCTSLERMANEVAKSYRATAKTIFISGVPPLMNDPEYVDLYKSVADKIVGENNVKRAMPISASDDFAQFLEKVPGVYAFVGCRNEDKGIVHYNHHPLFDIDEDALPIGSALLTQYAFDFLDTKS